MSGQIIDTLHYRYARTKVRDKSGKVRYSANNKDALSRAMLGMTKEELLRVANDNKLGEKLAKHVNAKNLGHFRMILGQALRGMVKRGVPVRVRGVRIASLDQPVGLARGLTEEAIVARPASTRPRKTVAPKAVAVVKKRPFLSLLTGGKTPA